MNWRVAFSEEASKEHALILYVAGDIEPTLLDGLEAFIQRQRERLIHDGGTETERQST